jgi:hypothetical protein
MAGTHPKPTDPRFQDLTGQTFGRWTVLEYAGRNRLGRHLWLCECSCERRTRRILAGNSLGKASRSCGCLSAEASRRRCREMFGAPPAPVSLALCEEIRRQFGCRGEVRPVPSAPGYAASDDGRIFSAVPWMGKGPGRPRQLTPRADKDGYLVVKLSRHAGGRRGVHHLAADAFLPPPLPGQTLVRHLNDVPSDNRVVNLAWGTLADNAADALANGRITLGEARGGSRLTAADVLEIRRRLCAGRSKAQVSREFGLAHSHVAAIERREMWKHV